MGRLETFRYLRNEGLEYGQVGVGAVNLEPKAAGVFDDQRRDRRRAEPKRFECQRLPVCRQLDALERGDEVVAESLNLEIEGVDEEVRRGQAIERKGVSKFLNVILAVAALAVLGDQFLKRQVAFGNEGAVAVRPFKQVALTPFLAKKNDPVREVGVVEGMDAFAGPFPDEFFFVV